MNLSEIIITLDQLPVFIIVVILTYSIYYYLRSIIPDNINIHPGALFVLLYIMFLIINRITITNTDFSKPLTKYLLRKKNYKEEAYHINYINPFVTNLDKVDFNMKKRENKEYIKKILGQLLIRKYVSFQNVLGYINNPWETIKLEVVPNDSTKYIVNDKSITDNPLIDNNMYCRNYIDNNYNCLILYRKYVLKFINKKYFIFEKKNKQHSKYFLRECISQVNLDSGNVYTVIDTRDLYYDRQYILFKDLPASGDDNKWTAPTTTPAYSQTDRFYSNFKDDPVNYHWQDDNTIYDVIVVDIHYIYNQMMVLDEDIMDNTKDTKNFALNKYYENQSWMEKKYFNFIKYQFSNRISGTTNIQANNIEIYKNGNISDSTTVKFRKSVGNITDYNTRFDSTIFKLYLNNEVNETKVKNYLEIKTNTQPPTSINIDFEDYISKYLQGKPEKPANELVIVKDKNTKFSEENDLILDKNTVSYISFDFLNIKSIKEYRDKMNYIANSIVDKYYKEEVKSIDDIKYNIDSLQIIQLDNLYRYNKGKSRLILNNRVITPNNIGIYFKDIKKLRASYQEFLERVLKYKQTLSEKIANNDFSLNVSNNELLSILNNNPFNTKSRYLGQIKTISKITTSDNNNTKELNDKKILTSGKLVKLTLEKKTYRTPKKNPLFVKFGTTMNINSFNINPSNIYIIHYIKNDDLLQPQDIYLEQYLLEPDVSGNITKIVQPTAERKLTNSINLFDCTNMFRKESIGVSNLITTIGNNKFKVIFDNTPLEFKPLVEDTSVGTENMYIDRPNYVMLNFSKNTNINQIQKNIYENQLYKVINIQSTTSNSSAELTLESVIDVSYNGILNDPENNIFKDVLVSQFINSKNYIENVFFKKVEIPRQDRLLSDGPTYKFVIELKKQIISINPEITRNTIIDNYEQTMNRIIDLIYENEARKIHYEIPENIGIYRDTSAAVYSYKYKNNLYITYDKRNNPVNLFKNYSEEFLCKKVYRGSNFAVNMNSLYYLDSYQEYYKYFINLFKNTLGLHDEINYQCNEYYKSGSMLSNLKLPITFNKYVSFLNNYMLYYKTNIKIDDIDPKLLGKHVVINNSVCDNQLISVQNSNRLNSRLYKTFLKDFIYKHEIGRKGFEYDDAKKICERIFTVYDKNCTNEVYKTQPKNQADYNSDYYKHNKERDKCFTTLYNDDKEKDTYQFIADSKILDPTNQTTEVQQLANNMEDLKNLKNTCAAKLTQDTCNVDPNCSYNTVTSTCEYFNKTDMADLVYLFKKDDNKRIGYVRKIEKYNTSTDDFFYITLYIEVAEEDMSTWVGLKSDYSTSDIGVECYFGSDLLDTSNIMYIKDTTLLKKVPENSTPESYLYRILEKKVSGNNEKDKTLTIRSVSSLNAGRFFSGEIGSFKKDSVDVVNYNNIKGDQVNHNFNDNDLIYVYYSPGVYTNILQNSYYKVKPVDEKKFKIYSESGGSPLNIDNNPNDNTRLEFKKDNKKIIDTLKNLLPVSITNDAQRKDRIDNIYNLLNTKIRQFNEKFENIRLTDNKSAEQVNYKTVVEQIENSGNLRFFPHRLAHLNEIKTSAYYGADWDNIGWINASNPMLENKSNLVKVKDKKVLWIDPDDENAINKGVICYGRKLDQDKLGANQRNEMFNFQMEKVEQSIKDIQKYENVSDFNKEVYSRWNL